MEQANAFVALAGDRGNSVPKLVTPAEVEILRRAHGDDAVHDITMAAPVSRSKPEELARLHYDYQSPRDQDGKKLVATMFPSHTLLPMTFEELGLPETFYAATGRAVPRRTVEVPVEQVHGAPGVEPPAAAWSNTHFEPIDVPADPDTQPEQVGRMVDPTSQHQVQLAPGDALLQSDDGDPAKLRAIAERQGLAPGQSAESDKVATRGSKTDAEIRAELAPVAQEGDKGAKNDADALFS